MLDSDLSEFRSEASEFRSRGQRMSSVAAVRPLTREIGKLLAPDAGWQQQVTAVHRRLTDGEFEWHLEPKDLTWNRVKTWFFGEARRVDFEEVVALRELKALEEARRDHRNFIATTNRLAAALAAEGASLSRVQMEALARIASRPVDVPRDHDARSRRQVRGLADTGASLGGGL
ncbi:hypothetical protein [Mesorhizobium sp.]|uniref:hypothetical protein n=1 Tax=Mesorhizobium sp. TaxID=1871066 RepID=UPI000FE57E4C|nr:hypothetical protein [Mesorhizobium sp.]RWM29446.1 MAG: hypothetical protein EOR74_07135 [Mesorhizobium sp.]